MIWNDEMIREWARENVTPYDDSLVNPASLDLRLGDIVQFPRTDVNWVGLTEEQRDIKKFPGLYWRPPEKFDSFLLYPGKFVLCHSLEFTRIPPNASAVLYVKSSAGRMGIENSHAGYGDPGFAGQWTFEMTVLAPWPVLMRAGDRIVQIVLEDAYMPKRTYDQTGRYQNQTGPTPARMEATHG